MVYLLDDNINFPDPSLADPDGLLAIGGDLSVPRLILAYQNGIFPWYDEDSPILWYAPIERFVIYPDKFKVSKSLKQTLKSNKFTVTYDSCFSEVIENCAQVFRKDQDGTWIIPEMRVAYCSLHELGYAHSIEVWEKEELVGGLYGIQVRKLFCGESMFTKVSNASKVALYFLAKEFGIEMIDCQIESEHLKTMGGELISQKQYLKHINRYQIKPNDFQRTL